jgi:subtilase family serine protease
MVSGNSQPLKVCTDPGTESKPPPCTILDLIENSLDVEWAGAVAKGAQIVLVASYPASASDDGLYDSASYIVNHVNDSTSPVYNAHIMNVSYGACELSMGTAGNVEYYNLWQSAAAEGIAVFVASGDAGAADCDEGGDSIGNPYSAQYGLSVNGLASTPNNTAVGGTDFNWCSLTSTAECTAAPYWNPTNAANGSSAKGYVPEVPWNDTCANPLVVGYLEEWANSSYANGVGGVTNPESACDFVYNDWQTVETNTNTGGSSNGIDLAYFIDTVGGGGGASGCVVGDGSNVSSCASSTTSTGTANGSIPLFNDGWIKPAWQSGIQGIPSDSVRDLPDVSFFASDGSISTSTYLICVSALDANNAPCSYSTSGNLSAQGVGGTSVATATMAGVMALIDQKAGAAQGTPNAELYLLAAQQTYSSCSAERATTGNGCYFNDIDANTNAVPCDYGAQEGNPAQPGIQSPNCSVLHSGDLIGILAGYGAGTGYDQATGLGSLNVANVVNAWPAAAAGAGTAVVAVTPAQNSISASSALSVPVTVAAATQGGTTPTGTVTLSGGGYASTAETLSGGSYSFTIPANSLSVGSDTLTVNYSGDSNYASATGTANVTVTAATTATGTFTLSATTPAAVAPGTSATSTITVSTTTGYVGTATLSCALTSPAASSVSDAPTCSLSSTAVTLSSTTTSATTTATVSTTAATASEHTPPNPRGKGSGWMGGGAVLAFLVFLGIPARRRSWRSMLGAVVVMMALGGLSGCGNFWQDPYTAAGTSAGTYTFTVTGTGVPQVTAVTTTFTVTVN